MTLNNTLSKLRSATTKVVLLPALTQRLRESDDIPPTHNVLVQVRKVRAAEIVADTGATPLMLSVLKERREGESQEEFKQRLTARMSDDPSAIRDMQRQMLETQEAIVIYGVVAIAIAEMGTHPAWDALTLERFGEHTIDLLGDDLSTVHDAIVEFSNLPYQRLGRAGTEAFPEEQPGSDREPGGRPLRDDAQPVPEPPAG